MYIYYNTYFQKTNNTSINNVTLDLPNTSIDTFIKIAAAKEFLLPFSSYYAYSFTAEYYIGTADLRGVRGGRKNGLWIRESTKKMLYNFTAAGAPVFHAIVALISRAYYGPSIERAKSNISRYKRINGENLHLRAKAKLRVLNEATLDSTSAIKSI